jgi:hypothetical protein
MVRAVHFGGVEQQFGERKVEQLAKLVACPVGAYHVGFLSKRAHCPGQPVVRDENVMFMIFHAPF